MPDFGKLEYSAKEMNFIYRGTVYAVSDYPYEPCLYLKKDGRLLSVIHNSFTVDNLIRVFSEGGSVHDVDRESTAYDEAAVKAAQENIENETYPLASCFYAVTRSDANENTHQLLNWICGPQGQALVEKCGYTPISATE